jgi:phosphotransferase system enzyme I (PtsI)
VTSLSAATAALQGVGARLGQVSLSQCRAAADAVLAAGTAAEARVAAKAALS